MGIIVALVALTGASHAQAGESLKTKAEKKVTKMESYLGLPVESVLCHRKVALDFDRGYGHLKGLKCRTGYIYGSDHWEIVWWLPREQDLVQGQSVSTPWYNGDWYVDCRMTDEKAPVSKSAG